MTDHEKSRAAFLAWYERQCDENPQLRTPVARVLAWRAWQANAGANMGNSHVSAVKLPEPSAWMNDTDAHYVGTSADWQVSGDKRDPGDVAMYTRDIVLALLESAGLVPAQDPKE